MPLQPVGKAKRRPVNITLDPIVIRLAKRSARERGESLSMYIQGAIIAFERKEATSPK